MIASSTGAKISIGPVSANTTAAAFAALAFTEIGSIDQIPSFGAKNNIVKFVPLNTGVMEKRKGSADYGDPALTVFHDATDPGQQAALAAYADQLNAYAFKVEIPDASSNTGTDSVFYFNAFVVSAQLQVGAIDQPVKRVFELAITGDVVEVPGT